MQMVEHSCNHRFGGSFPCYTTGTVVGVRDRHAKPAPMVFGPGEVVRYPAGADLHHAQVILCSSPSGAAVGC
jgi:hypothetical protein